MNQIEKKLLNGNKRYINKISANSELKERIAELTKGQTPYAIVVTCSDSRVVPEKIFDACVGELFVIRTAGNVINEGELASIEYGVEHLGIKYCLVLGHTHCGAVHAAIHREEGKYLRPILGNIINNIGDEKNELKCTSINALKQVEYLKSKFNDSNCVFASAIFDIENSKVTWLK